MNRKSFFRNLLGTVAATIVGKTLDWIPEPANKPFRIVNQMKRYKKEFRVVEGENIILQHSKLDKAMWDAQTKWMSEMEMAIWYGKPSKSKT